MLNFQISTPASLGSGCFGWSLAAGQQMDTAPNPDVETQHCCVSCFRQNQSRVARSPPRINYEDVHLLPPAPAAIRRLSVRVICRLGVRVICRLGVRVTFSRDRRTLPAAHQRGTGERTALEPRQQTFSAAAVEGRESLLISRALAPEPFRFPQSHARYAPDHPITRWPDIPRVFRRT